MSQHVFPLTGLMSQSAPDYHIWSDVCHAIRVCCTNYCPLQLNLGPHFLENNKIICSVHNVETLHKQRMISIVVLHETLNMMRCAQSKQSRCSLFVHWDDVEIGHFKPWSSNDVTKIKDTFYIE